MKGTYRAAGAHSRYTMQPSSLLNPNFKKPVKNKGQQHEQGSH